MAICQASYLLDSGYC